MCNFKSEPFIANARHSHSHGLMFRAIDGHRAVLARAGVVPQRAVVPHGPCLLRARAWPTAQGTVRGPFGRAVPPVGHGQFCRAGLARGPFKREG